jgi:hypothetical protein
MATRKVPEKSQREEKWKLVRSCRLANQDPEVRVIEEAWDRIPNQIDEPWRESRCSKIW